MCTTLQVGRGGGGNMRYITMKFEGKSSKRVVEMENEDVK